MHRQLTREASFNGETKRWGTAKEPNGENANLKSYTCTTGIGVSRMSGKSNSEV